MLHNECVLISTDQFALVLVESQENIYDYYYHLFSN